MKTLIKNIWLADGEGGELRHSDLLFDNDKILQIGEAITSSAADSVFDGKNRVLAPGFIDAHDHSDSSILVCPNAEAKIAMGSTAAVAGQCGMSVFPVTDLNREHLEELEKSFNLRINWDDYSSFIRAVEASNPAIRLFFPCGHNALRSAVVGYEKKKITSDELRQMGELLTKQIRQGAIGLSFGLIYIPGTFSDTAELEYLAGFTDLLCVHIRNEADRVVESMEEILGVARRAGVKHLQISHLKTAGTQNWHKINQIMTLIDSYEGSIGIDRYPYLESKTNLSTICPEDTNDAVLARELQDPVKFNALVEYFRTTPRDWSLVRLANVRDERFRKFQGMTFDQISPDPGLVTVEILKNDPNCGAAFGGMCEENMRIILNHPKCVCGSDELACGMDYSSYRSHPRGFGSFPRFIRFLLDGGMSIGEAVRKCTGLTADFYNLSSIGYIREGMASDLVIFDPETLDSKADFVNPNVPAEGIDAVWSKGVRRAPFL